MQKMTMLAVMLSACVAGAQMPMFEMVRDPFGETGFEPLGFGGGASLIGIREHHEGGWEYGALTATGIEVFDFASLSPSRPRAAGFRGDWFLFEGLDASKRDHRLAITRDGRMNEAWSPFEGSRLEQVSLGINGTIAAIDYTEKDPTGFSNGILVFNDSKSTLIPGSDNRSLHGITNDGRFFASDNGLRSSLWSINGTREEVPVPYEPFDFVLPLESTSSHGVPVIDVNYISGDPRTDTFVTYINGESTVYNVPQAVFNAVISDADLNGMAVGTHFDDRFWTWTDTPPLRRGSLWLDGELFLLDDLVDKAFTTQETISRGLSISTEGEILAVFDGAGQPAEFVLLRPIPSPGSLALLASTGVLAVWRRRSL
ncbi:MAG: hypothetical protein AAGD32_18425 [Planctomycetota bacterium]